MTLRREQIDVLVNIGAKVAVGLLPLAFVPIYVRFLGLTDYGVFVYALNLIAFAALFDLGLSPALTRAFSLAANRACRATILRTFELTYAAIGFALLVVGGLAAGAVALFAPTMVGAMRGLPTWASIAALLICSWPASLYCGALLGANLQVRLNLVVFGGTLARYLLGLALLAVPGAGAVHLLLGHAAGFLAMVVILRVVAAAAAGTDPGRKPGFCRSTLRGSLGYAGQTWLVGSLIVVLAQIDKQVLAASFGLAVFSSYAIAWALSSAALNMAHPVGSSYFPGAVTAFESGDTAYLTRSLRDALHVAAVLILAPAAVAASFADDLIEVWLGGAQVSRVVSFVVPLLYATQLGVISALAQSFLTAFAKVGGIILTTGLQIAVMAVGAGAVFLHPDLGPVAFGFLWIVVQAVGAGCGIALLGRAIGVGMGGYLAAVAAALLILDGSAWAVHAVLTGASVPSLARLALGGVTGLAAAGIFIWLHKFMAGRLLNSPGFIR